MARALVLALVPLVLVACSDRSAPPLARAPVVATTVSTETTSSTTTTSSSTSTSVATAGPVKALISTRGVVVPVLGRAPTGWRVRTPCGNQADLGAGTPLTGATVVLDPGHGGNEPGAVGPNSFAEGPLNLAVAGYTKRALERVGVDAVLTRTGEYQVALANRTELVMSLRPRAFVSIHHNSDPDGPWPRPGTETYYQLRSASSKRLAGLIWEEVVAALSAYAVPWVADTDAGAKYRVGDNGDYYFVLRTTPGVTSVIAELAFISDPPEAALLARPDVQRVEGEAVARGIVRYLTTKDPGSGFTVPYPRPPPPPGPGGPGPICTDPQL